MMTLVHTPMLLVFVPLSYYQSDRLLLRFTYIKLYCFSLYYDSDLSVPEFYAPFLKSLRHNDLRYPRPNARLPGYRGWSFTYKF